MIHPRPYQTDCLLSVLDRFSNQVTRQLISLPTGTGKTVVFSLIAKQREGRVLILAHRDELLTQAKNKLQMIWPEASVGIVRAASDEVNAQVVIASVQTACRDRRLKSLLSQEFSLLICDEAHHSAAPSYRKVFNELGFMNGDPRKLLVGVTATPRRGDGVGLGSIFEEIVFERSISTMIAAGYLSPLVGKRIVTRTDLASVGFTRGDFVASQLSRAVNTPARNDLILDNYKIFASERKRTIAFCADVQHAKDLSDTFIRDGITSAAVYGDLPKDERTRVLQDFSEGRLQVLTNCSVLTEGFDDEQIDCVILARPTASAVLYTQMIGRGTRTYPTKKDCLILDFADNSARHNLCNFKNTLDGAVSALDEPERDEADEESECIAEEEIGDYSSISEGKISTDRIEDIDFFRRSAFAWIQVGESWHLKLTVSRDVWVRRDGDGFRVVAHSEGCVLPLSDRPIPLNYAMGIAEDWAREQTTRSAWMRKDAGWRSKPATQKQIQTLQKFGIPVTGTMTGGEASELLDRKINEPATDKQRYWLCTNGVTFDPSITKLQAAKIISEAKGGRNG